MVGQRVLVPFILVRIQVRQLFNFRQAQISESANFFAKKFSTLRRIKSKKIEDADERSEEVQYFNLMPYYTYILECADGSFYVGCTNDLDKRLKQHNDSKWGAHYTKIRRPVTMKYFETFDDLKIARRRETELKGWRRDKKLCLIKNQS